MLFAPATKAGAAPVPSESCLSCNHGCANRNAPAATMTERGKDKNTYLAIGLTGLLRRRLLVGVRLAVGHGDGRAGGDDKLKQRRVGGPGRCAIEGDSEGPVRIKSIRVMKNEEARNGGRWKKER